MSDVHKRRKVLGGTLDFFEVKPMKNRITKKIADLWPLKALIKEYNRRMKLKSKKKSGSKGGKRNGSKRG